MNLFARTLITTFPLVCAVAALAAPAAAHAADPASADPVCSGKPSAVPAPAAGRPPVTPVCSGGPSTTVPTPMPTPRPVPVRITVHDLSTAPPASARRDAAPVEVEIVVRGGGTGSAAEVPALLRDLVRALSTPQRVPTPRPHR
ncbi:hypothetical protein [Nocardia neocaledoniensis]|uniref:hypothetical protein n=1 Tax=Nocardia neocaledoniensis TaxID=236511 RepID=UPI0024541EC6|nr:hypothetical protein [Nocardia neocaledoniensis]